MHTAASEGFYGKSQPCTKQAQGASVGNLTHAHSSLRVLLWEISPIDSRLRVLLWENSPKHTAASDSFCASVGNLTHAHSSLRVLLWEISPMDRSLTGGSVVNLNHAHSSLRVFLWEISPLHTAASGYFCGKSHAVHSSLTGVSLGNLILCTQQAQGASVGNLTHDSRLRVLLWESHPCDTAASEVLLWEISHMSLQQPQGVSVGNLTHAHSSLRVLL